MGYLLPAEYAAFGLTAETADAWVVAASAMIEAYCRRPTLLAQTYVERLRVGQRTHGVRLSYAPLESVTEVRARFAVGHANGVATPSFFGDDVAAAFCAPGSWVVLDVSTLDIVTALGEVRLPHNLLGAMYSEVEVTYAAGFAETPVAVKVACAQIVRNAQATPGLNVRASRVATLQMQYFSGSLIDPQVVALLAPFVAERGS